MGRALTTIVFLGLVIIAIVLPVGDINKAVRASRLPRTPEQLLAERFAWGELDEAEYQRWLVATTARRA